MAPRHLSRYRSCRLAARLSRGLSRRLVAAFAALLVLPACAAPASGPDQPTTVERAWVLRLAADPELQVDERSETFSTTRPAVDMSSAAAAADFASQGQVLRLESPELETVAARLAVVLGLDAAATREPDGLRFGDAFGVAASLTVAADGQWQYSAGQYSPEERSEGESLGDDSGADVSDGTSGTDLSGRQVEDAAQQWLQRVYPEARVAPWQTQLGAVSYTSTRRLVGEYPSGIVWGFGFSSDLSLLYAHGWLVTPSVEAQVAVVAPSLLLDELSAQLAGWTDPGSGQAPSTFTVRSVHTELVPVRDVAGVWWLVPGYRFHVDPTTGAPPFDLVLLALDARHITRGDSEDDLMDPAETLAQAEEAARRVIGMVEEDAIAMLERQDLLVRVSARDGVPVAFSGAYRPGRVVLTVHGGTVTAAEVG